jgi:hypothetical protein
MYISVLKDILGTLPELKIRFFELSSVQSLESCRSQIEKLAKNAKAVSDKPKRKGEG